MRLVSYRDPLGGVESWGVLKDGAVIAGASLANGRYRSVRDVLRAKAIASIEKEALHASAHLPLTALKWLPTIPNPDKIFCVGLNYKSHIQETGRTFPEEPSLFVRVTNSVVAHDDALICPKVSAHFDYEGELAVIIGRTGRHIPEDQALNYVAGYSCFNDGSVRDFQKHSVTAGKNFHASAALGPCMVTADEIPDPSALVLVTRLNGQEVQRSSTGLLIYSIQKIISYISQFTELVAGDVIATGTPEGVGARRNPPLWMKPGDVVEVDVSGIGVLRNRVVNE